MRLVVAFVVCAACGGGEPKHIGHKSIASCTISVTSPGPTERVAINGVVLADFAMPKIEAVLGKADRVERVTKNERYEESGPAGNEGAWTSSMEPVSNLHYVYDRYGLVFRTNNGVFGGGEKPEILLAFLANPRQFDNTAAPDALPKQRGICELGVNGVVVDPNQDLRPRAATYQTNDAKLFGTTFKFTSFAMVIDSIYTAGLTIYLDAPATGRASYVEIR